MALAGGCGFRWRFGTGRRIGPVSKSECTYGIKKACTIGGCTASRVQSRTRTRTNTNPYDIKAIAVGKSEVIAHFYPQQWFLYHTGFVLAQIQVKVPSGWCEVHGLLD
jgi:hypothetical protein